MKGTPAHKMSDHKSSHPAQSMTVADRVILGFDRGLRTLAGRMTAGRPSPARDLPEADLNPAEKRHAAGLMRINHTGEVCAQALYEGQALIARKDDVRALLLDAASEETDHLVWCQSRLDELEARPSVLNPLFYACSWSLGVVTGALGDRTSLGFVEATEEQVSAHLSDHLSSLPIGDQRSRAIVSTMRADETAHGENALRAGGVAFPKLTRSIMRLASRVMTTTTYRI